VCKKRKIPDFDATPLPFLLGSVLFGYYPKIEETEAIKTKIYLVEITKIYIYIYIYNVSKIILE